MRGHIIKRYNDSYTIVLNLGVDPATGKRKQQWVSVKGTKKEAEKRLAELLHQLDTGTFMKPGKVTLADYLEQWIKDCSPNSSIQITLDTYSHVAPGLQEAAANRFDDILSVGHDTEAVKIVR